MIYVEIKKSNKSRSQPTLSWISINKMLFKYICNTENLKNSQLKSGLYNIVA